MAAADQFASDSELIENRVLGMLNGSPSLGINKFEGTQVAFTLVQFADLYSVVKTNVQQILEHSPNLFKKEIFLH